ncbi:hypothetical protein [Maribacter aurantiacus]|uniref:hypothetical protein n=1 Tax=Maribacter aurantiacus TaxID=1882343 RepID=UPI00137609EA|nr:hypothetical protein [Maribacter aurantiacus]
MGKRPKILKLFEQYGLDHGNSMSPEEWFIKFEQKMLENKDFGEHLKEIGMHWNTSQL